MNTLNGYSKSTLSDLFTLTASGGHFPIHSGRNNEKNKLVRTDASGYILAGWINTLSGDMGTTAATRIYCSNDAYIRYKTLANFSSDIAGQLYWANVKVSTSSNAATTPQFGNVTICDGTNSFLYLKTATAGAYAYLAGYNTGGQYGADVVLHSGSSMVLGAGESAAAMYSNNIDSLRGSENLYLTADNSVKIFAHCDSIGNRRHIATFSNDGYAYFNSYINIGGHEKNASSPTYVWGSNSSDSYLRSYQTSSLSVGCAQKLQVHDVRSATRTPNYFEGYKVTSWFNNTGTPNGDWWSGIHVKGWSNGYASWELCSYSSTGTSNNYNLYFRSGNNDTWGSWKTVLDSSNYSSYALPLSGGTMSGSIGMGSDATKWLITTGANGANSPLRGIKMPTTISSWLGLFARPSKGTDEGGLLLSEDTCVIYNSFDTGYGLAVYDTDMNLSDWSGNLAFGINTSYQAWAKGGFVKNGSDNTYVLLGGGGHKAVNDFATSGHIHDDRYAYSKVIYYNTNSGGFEQITPFWFKFCTLPGRGNGGEFYTLIIEATNGSDAPQVTTIDLTRSYNNDSSIRGWNLVQKTSLFYYNGQGCVALITIDSSNNIWFYYDSTWKLNLKLKVTIQSTVSNITILTLDLAKSTITTTAPSAVYGGNIIIKRVSTAIYSNRGIIDVPTLYENGISLSSKYLSLSGGTCTGNIYAPHFYESSDIRYKKVLRNLSIDSNTIANLPLFDFEWIENNTIGTGTSAQAVQKILPNLVSGTDKLTLDYGVLGTIAGITACKELVNLKSEIELLKEKIELLEQQLKMYHGNSK